MNNLRRKTFYTIFFIISLFIVFSIFIYNRQIYKEEYRGIENNLTRMRKVINNNDIPEEKERRNDLRDDLDNRLIMNYYVYTILLDRNNNIIYRISHNEEGFNERVANKIDKILNEREERAKNQKKIKNCKMLEFI